MTIGVDQRDTAQVLGAYFDALLREDAPGTLPETVADAAIVNMPAPEVAATSSLPSQAAAPAAVNGSYQMISVSGVTLGVPSAAIDNIAPLDSIRCTTSAASDGTLGCYAEGAITITVVDTARLLLPDQAAAPAHSGFVLRLKNQPWALRCDAVGSTFAPVPEAIHWRGASGKRLWLAGTVREPGCALLDIPELLKLLPR